MQQCCCYPELNSLQISKLHHKCVTLHMIALIMVYLSIAGLSMTCSSLLFSYTSTNEHLKGSYLEVLTNLLYLIQIAAENWCCCYVQCNINNAQVSQLFA